MRFSRKMSRLAYFLSCLSCLAVVPHATAHDPAAHRENPAAADEQAMKAQHERMENFKTAMSSLLEAVVDGNVSEARDQAARLMEALAGHEKDVPHKNSTRIQEFKGLYAELKKRIGKLSGAARSGGIPGVASAYGRVLETCAACHAKFRD